MTQNLFSGQIVDFWVAYLSKFVKAFVENVYPFAF